MASLFSNDSEINGTYNYTWKALQRFQQWDIFKIAFETIIAFFGVLGNIAVCAIVTKSKKRTSSSEFLFRNLAIADLGVLLVIFPLAVVKEKLPFQWPFGELPCLYLYPLTETFYSVSVWTIVCIAVERYRHLTYPKKQEKKRVTITKRLVAVVWIGCFLVFSASLFYWMKYVENHIGKLCFLNFGPHLWMFEAYTVILLMLYYVIPLGIITWTYACISQQLHRSNVFLKGMNCDELSRETPSQRTKNYSATQKRRLSQNKRVKKILTPVVIAFVLTMLPVNLVRVILFYRQDILQSSLYPILIYFVALCLVINSSINPVIYCFVSSGFRRGVVAFLKRGSVTSFSMSKSAVREMCRKITFKVKR